MLMGCVLAAFAIFVGGIEVGLYAADRVYRRRVARLRAQIVDVQTRAISEAIEHNRFLLMQAARELRPQGKPEPRC